MPTISAVLCSYNRPESLCRAIQSLITQDYPENEYEIIVVDNGVSHPRKEIITRFSGVTHFRYMHDPVAGLSRARNTGWVHAKGTYIAYLDDDAIAEKNWLSAIAHAFHHCSPGPGCVGGPIRPCWPSRKPAWLSPELEIFLSLLDYSSQAHVLDKKKNLCGANIAFPKKLLEKMGGFDTGMGRVGTGLRSGEDSMIQHRLRAAGYPVYYDPAIAVEHCIRPERLTVEWFTRRAREEGRVNAALCIGAGTRPGSRYAEIIRKSLGILFPPGQLMALLCRRSHTFSFSRFNALSKCAFMRSIGGYKDGFFKEGPEAHRQAVSRLCAE